MQYTANKPHNGVLIINAAGLKYRLQEDHVFKEIRYAQVREVKIKYDFFLFMIGRVFAPLQLLFFIFLSIFHALTWPIGIELIFWFGYLFVAFFIPLKYTVVVHKGPIVAEVFITEKKREAQRIKKEIESHL